MGLRWLGPTRYENGSSCFTEVVMTATRVRIVQLLMTLALALGAATPALAGGDWNDKGIKWRTYDEGLAEAKKSKKPVLLIFYTEWCPHCTNYSKVFHDPEVIKKSNQFVMIRIDNDKNQELGKKYALDGGYIPRTFFLSSSGDVDADIHAPRDKFKYFYDERNPQSVLAAMDAALKKLKN
jgi:thiol:disulfide interchange protein